MGWDLDLAWRRVPWDATYRTLKSAGNTSSTEQAFIRSQFLEYLEVIRMAPFEGFTHDDFDYFARPIDGYAPILKGKLMKFGQDVFDALPTKIREVYSVGPYLGKMYRTPERRWLWLAIRGQERSDDPLRQSNFTLEVDSEGVSINAVIRNGRFNQPWTAIGTLYAALDRQDPAVRKSLAVGSDFSVRSVRVYERVGPKGGPVMPGGDNWLLRGLIRLDHSANDVFTFLKLMLAAILLPGIHIRLAIPRWDARLHSGEELRDLAVRTIKQLEPIFGALRVRKI
jgi:hypothetical protein